MAHYKKPGEDLYSRQHFRRWAKSIPAVVQTIQALMKGPALLGEGSIRKGQVTALGQPHLLFTSSVTHTPTLEDCLLTPDRMWLLASWLPAAQTEEWELLFNSRLHGSSFNTFMGKAAERGPTLTLIRDKKGHLFGGYAADAWSKHGVFYGGSLSFLFGLLPRTVKFTATGANANMMWCGQGFSQLPNGLGWGGQVGYYGLFIDSSFEKGMSRPSATFSNFCLAADEVFEVDIVECWLLQQPEEEEFPATSNSSVLDRFKEDRHLMDLAGRSTQATPPIKDRSMGRLSQALQLCLLAGLLAGAHAKHSRWERVLQTGAAAVSAPAPAAKLLPPQGVGIASAYAPAPAPVGPPAVPKASDSLAMTNSTLNQLQTLGTYQSDHVSPPAAVVQLLNGSTYQTALGNNPAYAPQAFQFTHPDIFFQLDSLGIRQFHFNAWKDPNGTLAANPAGLKLAGITNATLDPKYSFFGFKTFNDPDFDWQSNCVTVETCLQLIQSWSVNHTNHIPITIYLEPREATLFAGNEASINQQLASKPGAPSALAKAYPIAAADLDELQNTVYRVFNQSAIVLPGGLMGNATSLQAATQPATGGSWPMMNDNRGKVIFVLVDKYGKYGPMYRSMFPDLRNGTFFVSQPGNNGTLDPSTVFVDFLGPLGGENVATWTAAAANKAVQQQMQQIQAAVRSGFIARAAADWHTVEAREDFKNRTTGVIKAGAQFVQTSFPDVSQLPKYAYSFPGTSNMTVFPTNYTAQLPLRLGMTLTAGRCDPQTSAGIIANETATGCGNAADNAALAPSPSMALSY
ncbi:hypothetical protein WJX75_009510 [Coccomyxa subellipsoidea]|uniref:TLDc domain-containing protein n=1 Tax=Coccomyxa subellipsoidea TaxID=248742 RepID=A0ABR2Z4H5_9CHLO